MSAESGSEMNTAASKEPQPSTPGVVAALMSGPPPSKPPPAPLPAVEEYNSEIGREPSIDGSQPDADGVAMNPNESVAVVLQNIWRELGTAERNAISDKMKVMLKQQREKLGAVLELDRIKVPLETRRKQVLGQIRKAVAGDEEKRVRDHIQERRSAPPVIRALDKISFTFGVLNIAVSEYILLVWPNYFWIWYSAIIPPLLLMRYLYYHRRRWHYFMLDFCYFVQLCCMFSIYVMPRSCLAQKVSFAFANGPLAWAVPLWRNSLVFHDMEKTSSVYIHLFPGWLAMTLRWYQWDPTIDAEACNSMTIQDLGWALLVYAGWQWAYFFKTEVIDRAKINADPSLQTSLRWLSMDKKNALNRAVRKLMIRVKIMRPDEEFDPHAFKTKVIFMGTQLVYTIVAMLPTPLIYSSFTANLCFALFIFGMAVWNGSNYYIEVFARRYWVDLESRWATRQQNVRNAGKPVTVDAHGREQRELSTASDHVLDHHASAWDPRDDDSRPCSPLQSPQAADIPQTDQSRAKQE